jgi:cholesterol oxidase
MNTYYDYIIIGSGFGGSVSAMRLAEKGYSVLVLEQGSEFKDEDFPKSNWNLRKYLWWPALGFYGFQKLTFTRHANILSGTGVGGGSLVYANTLRIPPDEYFENQHLKKSDNWKEKLAPFYETASFMLGRTLYPHLNIEDKILKRVAISMGRENTFEPVHVGVYFGDTSIEKDPYFNGEGPLRKGCIECAGCMVGCRENAKNTLVKNYLWFAQKMGAKIVSRTKAYKIDYSHSLYSVSAKSVRLGRRKKFVFQSKGLIISAGTLGTMELLLSQKHKYETLPNLSPFLGYEVCTNSENLSGITLCKEKVNNGVAITSSFRPDDDTSVEVVKFPDKSGALKYFFNMSAGKGSGLLRSLKMVGNMIKHPINLFKLILNFNWANNTVILLVMQTTDNSMKLSWQKSSLGGKIKFDNSGNKKVPAFIQTGQDVLAKYAEIIDGVPQNIILEVMFNTPTTAHILGGCPMGSTLAEGVIGKDFQVHAYPNMYITDGSVIQGNLGVNPSLTIAAQAEYAMSLIPIKS